MSRGSLGLVVPLSGLLLPIILFSASIPLSDPDGTPLIVQPIALRSLLAALITLLSAPHVALSILLVVLWLTALRPGALLTTLIPLLGH